MKCRGNGELICECGGCGGLMKLDPDDVYLVPEYDFPEDTGTGRGEFRCDTCGDVEEHRVERVELRGSYWCTLDIDDGRKLLVCRM